MVSLVFNPLKSRQRQIQSWTSWNVSNILSITLSAVIHFWLKWPTFKPALAFIKPFETTLMLFPIWTTSWIFSHRCDFNEMRNLLVTSKCAHWKDTTIWKDRKSAEKMRIKSGSFKAVISPGKSVKPHHLLSHVCVITKSGIEKIRTLQWMAHHTGGTNVPWSEMRPFSFSPQLHWSTNNLKWVFFVPICRTCTF